MSVNSQVADRTEFWWSTKRPDGWLTTFSRLCHWHRARSPLTKAASETTRVPEGLPDGRAEPFAAIHQWESVRPQERR